MRPGDPIPITGLGVVSALGSTPDELLRHLHTGEVPAHPVQLSTIWSQRRSARLAALLEGPEKSWGPPGVGMRRLSRPSRFAVAAAARAMPERASPAAVTEDDESLGVSMSTMFGPSLFTQTIMDQTLDQGPSAVSPSLFTECVANAPAAQISLLLRSRGPNVTLLSREAGPACAVIQALEQLRKGRATRMLAGMVDEITPFLHSRLDRFGALARASTGRPERARPFDRRRDGVLAAEGATVLLLGSDPQRDSDAANPMALVTGGRMAFDPTASRSGWGSGVEPLAAALSGLLEQCRLSPGSIDLIVSGAGGSRGGDRLDAGILKRVWGGQPLPPLLAPKSVTGEFGGAFLAAAVLAAAGIYRGTPVGDFEPDPELEVEPYSGPPLSPPRRTLITLPASGGPYGWLILERPAA
jgi:3-oxoacyl-[acyl-carrier-protein] synthase II